MAVESYEQIMARLNGKPVEPPKAATDFATYVQNLLLNPNPQGGMMSDAEAYRADPFRRQNAINASLDEALKKKQAEEAARAAAVGGGGGGMFGRNNTPYDSGSGKGELTKEQLDWLERETLDERGNRLKNDLFGFKPIGSYLGGGMLGLGGYLDSQVPTLNDLMYQQAMYNKTPAALQWMLPDSYQKANERISEYNSIMNGVTPYEDITPIFDIPGVGDSGDGGGGGSGAPYSPSSDGFSATGDGSGGYSTPTMSDPYGGVI
jgi:hypothetical protein